MFDRFFRKKEPLACPATAIVMLTVSEDPDKLLGAFRSDARAYVLKGVSAQELARVVRATVATATTKATAKPGQRRPAASEVECTA